MINMQQEMIKFVSELIQIPSVNGRHNEANVTFRIYEEACTKKLGLQSQIVAKDKQRPNIVVTIGNPNKTLFLFIAHLDTVAEGDASQWKYPPFSGTIAEGKIWGRGAIDNKAGIACSLYMMYALRDIIHEFDGCIKFVGVVDEESGADSPLGLRYLLEQNVIGQPMGAIYSYPQLNVTIGHRGLLRMVIEVFGESVHSWTRKLVGANAVMALTEILYKIENEQWPIDEDLDFPNLKFCVTPGTIFTGGEYESIIPNYAKSIIDIRTMPNTNTQEIEQKIHQITEDVIKKRQIKEKKLRFQVSTKNKLPAVSIGRNHSLAFCCHNAVKKVKGINTTIGGCGPANEGYMLIKKGIPTICGFGPTGEHAHAINENVDIQSLFETVEIYKTIVIDYCKNSISNRIKTNYF